MSMRLIRWAVLIVTLWCTVGTALISAQTSATPANKLQWDEVGQTAFLAGSAAYVIFIDGSTTRTPLTNVTCATGVPATNAVCTSDLPALTPGVHTIKGIQSISGADSAQSLPFTFTYVVVVTPSGFRIG